MRFAALLGLFVAARVAFAGCYTVSYIGGTVTMVGPFGGSRAVAYGTLPDGSWGGSGASSEIVPPDQTVYGHGSVTCAGQIVVTCTWYNGGDPSDLPPQCAVLTETASASWSGEAGNCADGLGHPETTQQYSGQSQGTKYTVVNSPGQSFQVACSPSAFALLSQGASVPGITYATATVSYRASVTPVSIVLSGTTRQWNADHALIGQGPRRP